MLLGENGVQRRPCSGGMLVLLEANCSDGVLSLLRGELLAVIRGELVEQFSTRHWHEFLLAFSGLNSLGVSVCINGNYRVGRLLGGGLHGVYRSELVVERLVGEMTEVKVV